MPLPPKSQSQPSSSSGFSLVSEQPKHRLICSIEGLEKCGKNHFSFTAPGPIYFHSFDKGDEGVVQKFMSDKRIYRAEYRLDIPPGSDTQTTANLANPIWDRFLANLGEGLQKGRTSIVDTGSEAFELLRMARFGKLTQVMPHHYAPVNQEWKAVYRMGFSSSGNLIVLHRLKDIWETKIVNGKEKSDKTGKLGLAGYKDTYFETQVNLRAVKENGVFKVLVLSCRQNPDLDGLELEGDMCNFATLGQMVYPNSKEEDWV